MFKLLEVFKSHCCENAIETDSWSEERESKITNFKRDQLKGYFIRLVHYMSHFVNREPSALGCNAKARLKAIKVN